MSDSTKQIMVLSAALLVVSMATDAFALAAPGAGTFAYDIYDIAINSILKGPIGFVAGAAAIVFGAVIAIQGKILAAVPAVLGGAALLKADSIVTTLGAII